MPRLWLIAPIYQKRGFVVIDGHPDIRYPVAEPESEDRYGQPPVWTGNQSRHDCYESPTARPDHREAVDRWAIC